jgi:nucleolar GTP-binding protein
MKNIPTVLSSDEMLDKAFRRVKKVRVTDQRGLKRSKAEATGKVNSLVNTLAAQLNKYVKAFPSIDRLHPFERELIDVVIGVDKLRHSLGAIDWARKTMEGIKRQERDAIKKAGGTDVVYKHQNAVFGRVSSVMDKVTKDLEFLREARHRLKSIPDIRPDEPIVVIAGAPNVGKSLIVRGISSGKPEIASYPFTTKNVSLGHMTVNRRRIQVMDTPGLLDRPLEERNPIELQAVAALRHLEGVFVFVFDPSETCGYSLNAQRNLLKELEVSFPEAAFIKVSNKSDVQPSGEGMNISAKTGAGIDDLLSEIENLIYKSSASPVF